MDNNTLENIQAEINDIKKELLKAKSWSIIFKLIALLIFLGIMWGFYKCRTIIKWLLIILLVWLFLGNTISSAFEWTSNVIKTIYTDYKQSADEEEQYQKELRAKQDAMRMETERVTTIERAKQETILTEASARAEVLVAEENAKQAEWERAQTEARNNAINQAIINGTWKQDTPPPVTESPKPSDEGVTVVNGNSGTQVRVIYTN
jgi:hypothetical protein